MGNGTGGGKNAYIPGYRSGGKTGTAQIYVDGVVSSDKHIGSFLGFAPAELLAQRGSLAERMDAYEGEIIRDTYRRCGTTVAVARELGISQATAARKVAKYVSGKGGERRSS